MNMQPLKTFLTNLFGKNEQPKACDCAVHKGLENIHKTFDAMHESVAAMSESLTTIYECKRKSVELFKIENRISQISAITKSPDFADMVVNRPHEVQKLRDELDALVAKSKNL